MSIILFLVILAALIFVHELGHFLAAKAFGVRVDEFAIGFPPRLLKWKVGETVYTLNLVPFGGFVKIFGENPDEISTEGPDQSRSFAKKPRLIQSAILVAGVAFNILFAWLLISGALFSGLPASADYKGPAAIERIGVEVISVLPDSPASLAHFEPGDRVKSLTDGVTTFTPGTAKETSDFIGAHSESELTFSIERGSQHITIKATPHEGLVTEKKVIGISLADIGILKLPLPAALIEGARTTYQSTLATTVGLFSFFKQAILGKANFEDVTGPVGIVNLVGEASDFGLAYLLNFTAFISINLAIINLLPFPALDGGRFAVVIIEAIVRRPLNYKYVNMANGVGFVLLILLMVVVSYHDIIKLLVE